MGILLNWKGGAQPTPILNRQQNPGCSMRCATGLRLMECLRLRVKDLEFERHQIVVREGKGVKDRVTMLPERLIGPLRLHLEKLKARHRKDLTESFGTVYLPYVLERKYPNANREWAWQYVFPAFKRAIDPRSGVERRHHLDPTVLQRAVKQALRAAGLTKPGVVIAFRHSFATHLFEGGYDIHSDPPWSSPYGRHNGVQFSQPNCRTVQELLVHKDVSDNDLHPCVESRRQRRAQPA